MNKCEDKELITSKINIGENTNIEKLRKDFIKQFCNKMKWDLDKLTNEQLDIIKSKKGYINPLLIKS